MAKHRSHSIEFKRQVAEEFIAGETLHGLARVTLASMNIPQMDQLATYRRSRNPR